MLVPTTGKAGPEPGLVSRLCRGLTLPLSSPHRDPPVRWLQPAYPGQVHPEGAGQTLAQLLPQVCRLPDAAGRQVLLQGRERLLQGGLLQVSGDGRWAPLGGGVNPGGKRMLCTEVPS